MASRAEIKSEMFDRFNAAFGRLRGEDARAVANEYARVFARYRPGVLRAAADALIESHGYRSWPTVAACRTACERAAATGEAGPPPLAPPAPALAPGALERVLTSPLGRAARDGGFAAGLAAFVRREGRVPDGREADMLRSEARAAETAARAIADVRTEGLRRVLSGLRARMAEREADLAARFGAKRLDATHLDADDPGRS